MIVYVIMYCLAVDSDPFTLSIGSPQCKLLAVRDNVEKAVAYAVNYCLPVPSSYEVGEVEKECRRHVYLFQAPLR